MKNTRVSKTDRSMRGRVGRIASEGAAFLTLLIGAIIVLAPFVWLGSTAFKNPMDAFASPPRFISPLTFENFEQLFESQFLRSVGNSLLVTFLTTAASLVIGAPAGYALARSRIPGQRMVMGWLAISYVTPVIVYIIPMFFLMNRLSLIDTFHGLLLAYLAALLPFTVWMCRSYFTDIPRDLDEAAWVDGYTKVQAFLFIIVPLARPGLSTIAILVSLAAWGEYFMALVLTGQRTITAPVGIYYYVGVETANWSLMAAAGLTVVLPVLLATIFVQRGLIRGLTFGAVKG